MKAVKKRNDCKTYTRGIGLIKSGTEYYNFNAHGDVVQLTDLSGDITKNYSYDAFGVEYDVDEDDQNPWRYCGEYFDTETGNVYLRARYYDAVTGRFMSEDPIRDGLNYYTYCGNNPITFVDPFGLAPTVMEAALMSEHVYSHVWDEKIDGRRIYDADGNYTGWRMIDMMKVGSLKIGVYVRGDGLDSQSTYTGSMEYVLSFKGTNPSSGEDWTNNAQQYLGEYSKHLAASVRYTSWFIREKSGYEITFTGHSKGGGEAAVNAMLFDKKAIVFNPSVPNITYSFIESRQKNVSSYVVTGDILNYYLGELPGNNTTYLTQQHNGWLPGVSITDRINNHSMESVIAALRKAGYR